jgi:hypothetical protein
MYSGTLIEFLNMGGGRDYADPWCGTFVIWR